MAQFDIAEETPPGKRKRSRKRGPLTLDDKIGVLTRVFVDQEIQADVAREYRVSAVTINRLVA